MTDTSQRVNTNQLGAYALPGRVNDPMPALEQARTAERVGLQTIWLSERYGTKDLAVLRGAIAAITSRIQIATGISHFLFRHPLVLASMTMTTQAISNGRFLLGVGRSVEYAWRSAGLPNMTNQALIDSARIHRELCAGRKVSYDGPAGRFPAMRLPDIPDVAIPPLVLAAIGPKTLQIAGAHFDGVLLHPFLTPAAVSRSSAIVRQAARQAGRDPRSVRIFATVVTAPDLPEEDELKIVGGRAVTYYQIPHFGELLARTNGWDVADLATLRAHPMLANLKGAADNLFSKDQLAEVGRSIPRNWLYEASAVGSSSACAAKLHTYLAHGADEIVIHGSAPELLGPTVASFRG